MKVKNFFKINIQQKKSCDKRFPCTNRKNWEKFSLELANLCKAHRKSKDYGENPFTRKISFLHLDCITLQDTCIEKKLKILHFLKMNFYLRILEFIKKALVVK